MNTKILKSAISLLPSGYGHYKVTYTSPITGKQYERIVSDMTLIDRIKNADICDKNRKEYGLTLRQALLAVKPYCRNKF